MKCYPKMNVKIIDILRLSDNLSMLYGAQRIEDLEKILHELVQEVLATATIETSPKLIKMAEQAEVKMNGECKHKLTNLK